MRSWLFLLLAIGLLIVGFVTMVLYENFELMLACAGMAWCSKLESEK